MSGGADSSVAALLLQAAGYRVTGVTFRFYESEGHTGYLDDARRLADRLGMEHQIRDVRSLFEEHVVGYFLRSYLEGRTPVPCTLCNRRFKWPLLAQMADEAGIHYIATGHYARLTERKGRTYLCPAADADKDQTFFLWGLPQEILQRMILPLGDLTRQEAQAYAAERGFAEVTGRPNSTGACFCPRDYRDFLRSRVPQDCLPGRGRFLAEDGSFLGWHEGYPFYTVGQRRGLGLQLNRPVYVKETRPQSNEVVLALLASLYRTFMELEEWNLVDPAEVLQASEVIVKIRYRKQANRCRVSLTSGRRLLVHLLEPLESIAPGQAAAFYHADGRLLGGGIICEFTL